MALRSPARKDAFWCATACEYTCDSAFAAPRNARCISSSTSSSGLRFFAARDAIQNSPPRSRRRGDGGEEKQPRAWGPMVSQWQVALVHASSVDRAFGASGEEGKRPRGFWAELLGRHHTTGRIKAHALTRIVMGHGYTCLTIHVCIRSRVFLI
jgi:hypothetical protein